MVRATHQLTYRQSTGHQATPTDRQVCQYDGHFAVLFPNQFFAVHAFHRPGGGCGVFVGFGAGVDGQHEEIEILDKVYGHRAKGENCSGWSHIV